MGVEHIDKRVNEMLAHVRSGGQYARTAERWLWLLYKKYVSNPTQDFGIKVNHLLYRVLNALESQRGKVVAQ